MGEKDFSDRAFVGDDSLSFVSRDVFRAVRERRQRSDRARGAGGGPVPHQHAVHDHAGRLGPHRLELQLDRHHHVAVDRGRCTIPTATAKTPTSISRRRATTSPALYSLLIAIEKLGFDLLPKLRQLNGLPGHPDVSTPFIAANTGSLGMGISKAYGMARANRYTGRSGRIVVMTGDGELQEGQIWESLQPVANERLADITVIVDHNKFQSDTAVAAVSDLGPTRGEVPRLRLGSAARRRPRLPRAARRARAFRHRHRQAEGVHRRHHQGQGRVVHGRHRLRRSDLSLPRRRAVARELRQGDARADRAREREARRARPAAGDADVGAAAGAHRRRRTPRRSCSPTATSCSRWRAIVPRSS